MSKPCLALLLLSIVVPTGFARPPESPSGRLAVDEAPALRADVAQLEREKDAPPGEVIATRARLAQAEGLPGSAAAEWRKLVTFTQAQYDQLVRRVRLGLDCDVTDLEMLRGLHAEAQCRLAEVERRPAALVEQLPRVIAYHYMRLDRVAALRSKGAISVLEAAEEEKATWRDLRRARLRLDAARRKLGQ
jgi:hypothetical protein